MRHRLRHGLRPQPRHPYDDENPLEAALRCMRNRDLDIVRKELEALRAHWRSREHMLTLWELSMLYAIETALERDLEKREGESV